jgi:hypothetical protein
LNRQENIIREQSIEIDTLASTAAELGAETETTKNDHEKNVASLSNQVQLYADKIHKLEQRLQEASLEVDQTLEDAAADIISIANQQN